jgi:4-hydroxy-tetrahydrodipicolinate synthase
MIGVVPILVTPFHEDGSIDLDSLRSLIDFDIDAGVHGLGVALGSEVFKLTEAERELVVTATVGHVAGRVPVVVNTSAAGTDVAIHLSIAAERARADALMVFPPSFVPVGGEEILRFYAAVDARVGIPIVLQDIPQAPIPPALALRIAQACPHVTHVKVETPPVVPRVAAMVAGAGDALTVFGGAGGSAFIEELRRGARGTMPFPSQPAAFVETWDRFQAGDEEGARRVFDERIMPVNRLGSQEADLYYHLHKQLLVRLGVIRTAVVRPPTMTVDAVTQREIDQVIDQVTAG